MGRFLDEVKSRVAPTGMVAAYKKDSAGFAEKFFRMHDKFKVTVHEFAHLYGGRLYPAIYLVTEVNHLLFCKLHCDHQLNKL